MGDIVETLTDPEEAYVTAHELSHIEHYGIVAGVMVGAGNSAIAIQKWAMLTPAAHDLVTSGWRTAIDLAATWLVLLATCVVYKLLAAAQRAVAEYLADAGAVKIVPPGWEGRVALVTGLARIHHALTRWRPFRIFRKDGTVSSIHPGIDDRAQALGFETRVPAIGHVQVGDVVIAA